MPPPVSYVPRRSASGTFPVSRQYRLRQMLYNHSYPTARVTSNGGHAIQPSFPFSDVPVYADTLDIETLAFHDFWGCLLSPDNVAARICTDDIRYHVWVAAKRVVESRRVRLADKEALVRAVMNQFVVELGLVLLDLCPGPLVLFVDPRVHDDSEQMVSRAIAMVAKFDEAHVRRWRIIVTLPATEQGVCAARRLTERHGIQTNLSLVSCLAHAIACIDAGARMVSMSVASIMAWFEQRQRQQCGSQAGPVSCDHPGIEAIQSCVDFIHRHGLNATLLTTDVREWAELKQLGGIGATALRQAQLDQIPMKQLVTWNPRPDELFSPPTMLADRVDSNADNGGGGFLARLPAERRSLVSAVLYVRLREMAAHMDAIDKVVWCEIKRRVRLERLETVPLERLYRPTSYPNDDDDPDGRRRRPRSNSRTRSNGDGKATGVDDV